MVEYPGLAPYLPDLSPGDSLMKPAEELAHLWVTEELDMKAIEAVAISAWKTYQLVYFLDKILQKSPLPPGKKKWGKSMQHFGFLMYRACYQGERETQRKPVQFSPPGRTSQGTCQRLV